MRNISQSQTILGNLIKIFTFNFLTTTYHRPIISVIELKIYLAQVIVLAVVIYSLLNLMFSIRQAHFTCHTIMVIMSGLYA